MKKGITSNHVLRSLLIVIGFCSSLNAVVSVRIGGPTELLQNETATYELIMLNDLIWGYETQIDLAGVDAEIISINNVADGSFIVNDIEEIINGGRSAIVGGSRASSSVVIGAGVLANFEITAGSTFGNFNIDLSNSHFHDSLVKTLDIQGLTVTVLPEPASLLILGLGGIFIQNRKKQRP